MKKEVEMEWEIEKPTRLKFTLYGAMLCQDVGVYLLQNDDDGSWGIESFSFELEFQQTVTFGSASEAKVVAERLLRKQVVAWCKQLDITGEDL